MDKIYWLLYCGAWHVIDKLGAESGNGMILGFYGKFPRPKDVPTEDSKEYYLKIKKHYEENEK